MLRSFKLHCALGTLALACGGSTDDELFGDASGVSNGGTSTGGRATASGGSVSGPTGGLAAVTGGRDAGTGGQSESGSGGSASPGSGGTSGGAPGMGGAPGEGGSDPGGGTTAGGMANPSGGMLSASGGNSGGLGGGVGGRIGKGGAGGTVSCQEARAATSQALLAAQACDVNTDQAQCLGFVQGECCPVPVNDPSSAETLAFQAALEKMNKACGASICATVLCVQPTQAMCQEKGMESGRCVSKSILSP